MRTKLFKSIVAVALVAFAASCAKEQTAAPLGGETEVTFNVASPVFQTKAIADGNTVDKVACCVYDKDGKLLTNETISQTIDMTNGKATFSVRLVTGQTYSFIFWAYKAKGGDGDDKDKSAYYTLSEDGKTVTVSYANAKSNDENRDAFYAYVEPFQITGALTQKVELKRPFAQLNFGVEKADIKAAKAVDADFDASKSIVTLTNLGNVLNLVDGTVTGNVEAKFDVAACPTEDLTVNGKDYGYVAMNYVLVGKDSQTLTDATLGIRDSNYEIMNKGGLKVTNVPLQGNYRTNILGNLFTSAANFNIVVEKAFETPDIIFVEVGDIASANDVIEKYAADDVVKVRFTASPEDASSQAILTTPVKTDGTLNIEISKDVDGTLYVGNYTKAEYSEESPLQENATKANKATVNITIPEGVTINELVICDETKTVNINGVNANSYSNTSVIKKLDAKTSTNTLIIEEGQVIESLTFRKGGLEIHGTVNAVTIQKDNDSDVILVRDCENLSNEVYEKLKDYIATSEGYVGIQNEDKSWNITIPVVMGGVGYTSLQGAIDAANTENQRDTIILFANIVTDKTITISKGKFINLYFYGHTITYTPDNGCIILADGGRIYLYRNMIEKSPGVWGRMDHYIYDRDKDIQEEVGINGGVTRGYWVTYE